MCVQQAQPIAMQSVCKIIPPEVLHACRSRINYCPTVVIVTIVLCVDRYSFSIPFASAELFPFPSAGPFAGPFPGPFAGPLAAGACHSIQVSIDQRKQDLKNTT